MLPATIDKDAPFSIMSDDRGGFHLLLVRKDMLGTGQPFVPLWAFSCGDQRSLEAASHWCEVRRASWQKWGALAQATGPEAFVAYMDKMIAEAPIGQVVGSLVKLADDPAVLILGETIGTGQGMRQEVMYEHRFGSPELRDGFLEWFSRNSNNGSVEKLLEIGMRNGTLALGKLLDEIAMSPDGEPDEELGLGASAG